MVFVLRNRSIKSTRAGTVAAYRITSGFVDATASGGRRQRVTSARSCGPFSFRARAVSRSSRQYLSSGQFTTTTLRIRPGPRSSCSISFGRSAAGYT
jgi:hypothetical protein